MEQKIVFEGNSCGVFLPFESCREDLNVPEGDWQEVLFQQDEIERSGELENIDFDKLNEYDWVELCRRNPDMMTHPESYPLSDKMRQVLLLAAHYKTQNIRVGVRTAMYLFNRSIDFYEIKAWKIDDAVPVIIHISKDEIDKILAPYEKEQKAVFEFLSSGDTHGVLPPHIERDAKNLAVSNLAELQHLLALEQPGPAAYFPEYKENYPCRLTAAYDLAEETRGVLLYHDQCERALQRLTGCTAEESEAFRRDNSGICVGKSRDKLLKKIEKHLKCEDAWEFYHSWGYYARYAVPRRRFQKAAFRVYKNAVKKLQELTSLEHF